MDLINCNRLYQEIIKPFVFVSYLTFFVFALKLFGELSN